MIKVIGLLSESRIHAAVRTTANSNLALMPRLLLALHLESLLPILGSIRDYLLILNLLWSLHKLETLCIFHGRLILDRFHVLLVVESDGVRVKVQHLAKFVRHIGPHFFIAAILNPDFQQPLLGSQRQGHADDSRLLKLLAYIML